MIRTLFLLASLLGVLNAFSQVVLDGGCTNPWALNYNPDALEDDGSCAIFPTTISYDAQLDDNIEIGTGISNLHMAIADHGPVQMGIKVNRRFISDVIPTNGNDYHVFTGYSPTSFNDPTPVPGLATWDFIFSFNLGEYTFEDLQAYVSIDFDPLDSEGQAAPYDLDISFVMASLGQGQLSFRQGSENLGFGFWQGLAGSTANLFDPLTPGVYDLGLRVENLAGNTLAEVSIRVIADDPIEGCTDAAACNYNPSANLDDDSCTFPAASNLDCAGNCLNDFNGNGVCDEDEVFGCTYPSADNFNDAATSDDGTCSFSGGTGTLCEQADFNNDGTVEVGDLLSFLSVYNESCE